MSTYLGAALDSIPLGYTILQMQNAIVGQLTSRGWQLLAQVDGDHSDVIPPVTETIGTSTFREVVRLYFPNNTTLTIGSYQACIANAYPQSILLTAKTAGAVQAGMTINGVTVLGAVGSSSSTANQNLQALYYALMDSVDPTIQGWSYSYNGADKLICTAKVPAAMVACSGNGNVTYSALGASVLAGARSGFVNNDVGQGYSVTVDLTNGFVYYMDIFSRSFKLGTRCLSGIYGPIFASYMDHATALAWVPDATQCTPIELVIGQQYDAISYSGKVTHWWSIPAGYGTRAIPAVETTYMMGNGENAPEFNPWSGRGTPLQVTDSPLNLTQFYGSQLLSKMMGELIFNACANVTSGNAIPYGKYKVLPVGSVSKSIADLSFASYGCYQNCLRFTPEFSLPDIALWSGTEPNESAGMGQVVPAPSSYPTLAQALDATTAYSSILLSSTAGLPSAGAVIIGTEEITYTGLSGNSITGTTMGANGTARSRHFVGHVVSPVAWFLKVNNGAFCCGPNKPV